MTARVERFAPSPTGRLHLGHAFSALTAWDEAQRADGVFRLRIEDIDSGRARPGFEAAIYEDLRWLGLMWPEPPLRQSERLGAYEAALARLDAMGLTYRCACTRRDILEAADAPQEGAVDGVVYPGTCKATPPDASRPHAVRLDMARALAVAATEAGAASLGFEETGAGPEGETGWISLSALRLEATAGDVVLARKDIPTSYHLAVVVDDAFEGVTHVTRGEDLFGATGVHVLLQTLLGLPRPIYRHHRLIRDETGRRLAKRADDVALGALRAAGWTPADVRRAVGLD